VQAARTVNPHLPIAWPHWPRGVVAKTTALTQKVVRRLLRWYINPIVEQQNVFNDAATRALEGLVQAIQDLSTQLQDARIEWGRAATRQQADREIQTHTLTELQRAIQTTEIRLLRLERDRLRPLFTAEPTENPEKSSEISASSVRSVVNIDIFRLGLRFRGPEDLAGRQDIYLDYFRGCHNVLDVGCGRGEFVALLRAHGIGARGIDLDADSVEYARARGLPVERAEALDYLDGLPDADLDGVFMAQVVEHLTPQQLLILLNLCYRKLQPGGRLVAETINPACLVAFTNWYLIDPTHVRPVHPETLRFLLESVGFWPIELRYLMPVPAEERLVRLPVDGVLGGQELERVERLNRNIDRLNEVLFGYQDYAAIAQRPPEDITNAD
jgi:O-antigen chain-terminating methyltransferase